MIADGIQFDRYEIWWDTLFLLKLACLVTLFDRKLQSFKKRQIDHFWPFWLTFVHSKCKRSSLRSQCWRRLFLRFSNTVLLRLFWGHLRPELIESPCIILTWAGVSLPAPDALSWFLHNWLCWCYVPRGKSRPLPWCGWRRQTRLPRLFW